MPFLKSWKVVYHDYIARPPTPYSIGTTESQTFLVSRKGRHSVTIADA